VYGGSSGGGARGGVSSFGGGGVMREKREARGRAQPDERVEGERVGGVG
jgi:hypothetical protein